MTKIEFLKQLERKLKLKNVTDYEDIVSYYEDIIDGKIERGLLEADVMTNYTNIDLIVEEILDENKVFTFSNFISERPNQQKEYTNLINPKKIDSSLSHTINVSDNYNLDINVWNRNVILNSANSSNVNVKYFRKIFNPIKTYYNNNSIKIVESIKYVWISAILQLLLFALIYFGFHIIFQNLIDKNSLWHLLVAGLAFFVNGLISLIYWRFNKNRHDIVITVPVDTAVNNLTLVQKSGNVNVNDFVSEKMIIKVLSGTIYFNNSFTYDLQLKISSGNAILGNKDLKVNKEFGRVNVITSSGNETINSFNIDNFNCKTSSGNLKIYESNINNSNIKISSGNIKGNDINFLNESNFKVSSGTIKLSNISLNQSNLKVSSGTIKLTEINGNEDDYIINSSVRSGTVKINDKKQMFTSHKYVVSLPTKQITAEVSSGTIKLNLKKQ